MTAFDLPSYELMSAALTALLVLAALLLAKAFFARQLRRLSLAGRLQFLSYPEQIVNATRVTFLVGVSLLTGLAQLGLPARAGKWIDYAWIVILVTQLALWANRIVTVWVERAYERHRESNPAGVTHLMLAGLIARIVLWSLAVLVALDNFGFNITTLMASLGIGGIAVALAVQNILGDVFSSVSIALDKPFVIGDFIIVDTYMGTVEYVGLKTTRIRSLSGEQIIISNTELLKNRIRNYKRMQERRVLFEFAVAYDTAHDELARIPQMVRDIVIANASTRFDRAHLKSCSDRGLLFEVVYYVLDPDYGKYMDIQQAINLALLQGLREQGVAFAFPTRTLHLVPPSAAEGEGAVRLPERAVRA